MRLIDADSMIPNGFKDKTIEVRIEDIIESPEKVVKLLFKDAVNFINKQPTVDAIERKRGEWKEITDRTMDCCYRCSECGFIRDAYFLEVTNFCPNCGADMRGDANE